MAAIELALAQASQQTQASADGSQSDTPAKFPATSAQLRDTQVEWEKICRRAEDERNAALSDREQLKGFLHELQEQNALLVKQIADKDKKLKYQWNPTNSRWSPANTSSDEEDTTCHSSTDAEADKTDKKAAPRKQQEVKGFEVFCKTNKSKVKDANPGATAAEVVQVLVEMWQQLKDEQKQTFEHKAAQESEARALDSLRAQNLATSESQDLSEDYVKQLREMKQQIESLKTQLKSSLAGRANAEQELDQLRGRLQELESVKSAQSFSSKSAKKDEARRAGGTTCGVEKEKHKEAGKNTTSTSGTLGGKTGVDASTLPRIQTGTSLATLKDEAKARGLKQYSSLGKQGLLDLLTCGSICLSQTLQFKQYEEVHRLMHSEKELARQKQHAEHVRKFAEEAQGEEQRVAALHSHSSPVHPCPLAPTLRLPGVSYPAGLTRANSATCNLCSENTERRAVCLWSCIKCDWDVCAECYEIEALPEAQRSKRRAELSKKRKREQAEEERRAEAQRRRVEEDLREYKESRKREKENRRAKELLKYAGRLGKFAAEHLKPPPTNKTPSIKGYVVWKAEGEYYDTSPSLDFDSAWTKLADANARAKYLFYFKNCWGLSVAEMLDDDDDQDACSHFSGSSREKVVETRKDGLLRLEQTGGDGGFWRVAVVPGAGTQFTCFTGTKVQILTQLWHTYQSLSIFHTRAYPEKRMTDSPTNFPRET